MRIGILGAGQLARMMVLAGYPLGLRFKTFAPETDTPCSPLCEAFKGDYGDEPALMAFASQVDVVTYEFENIPVEAALRLADKVPVYPPPRALEVSQDRVSEKSFFASLGIPVPKFVAVNSTSDIPEVERLLGFPCVLKTRRLGYDGKGQCVVRERSGLAPAITRLGGTQLIAEEFVSFSRELSVIAARSKNGRLLVYPLFENTHRDGILAKTVSPAPAVPDSLAKEAESFMRKLLDALDYVGVCALELFERDGRLVANEMAPRVHNSGHVTIEGSVTSQFQNHLRAVSDLPLGSTASRAPAVMLNLIGELPDSASVCAINGAHLHLYGKEPRPGRKIGHVTVTDVSKVAEIESLLVGRR